MLYLSNTGEFVVRVAGIEPASPAWEAGILPMYYTRANTGATSGTRTPDLHFTKVAL